MKHLKFTEEEWALIRSDTEDIPIDLTTLGSSNDPSALRTVGNVRLREPRKPCSLPLAPICTSRIDFEAFWSLPIPPSPEVLDLWEWIRGTRLRDTLRGHPLLSQVRGETSSYVSRHLRSEMPGLYAQGLFRPSLPTDYTIQVPLFKVPKASGTDARLIGDCRVMNSLLPKPPPMGLPPIHGVMERLLPHHVLHQEDGHSYFYQFGLSPSAAAAFGVRVGDARGNFDTAQMEVMTMGLNHAPVVAQRTSDLVSANTLALSDTSSDVVDWVDNFLFGAHDFPAMDTTLGSFKDVCRRVNLTLKPSKDVPGKTMEALGLYWNVETADPLEHFVALTVDFKVKLRVAYVQYLESSTPRSLFRVMGSVMWAIYTILRRPLAAYPAVMNEIRKVAKRVQGEPRTIWDDILPGPSAELRYELESLINDSVVARLTLGALRTCPPTRTVWSDASNYAWGYVQQDDEGFRVASLGHDIADIFVAELLAAADLWFTMASEGGFPVLSVDNTGATHSLLKGHSRNKAGDLILRRLAESLPPDSRAFVRWVPTGCNVADEPSRCRSLTRVPCRCEHETVPIRWRC